MLKALAKYILLFLVISVGYYVLINYDKVYSITEIDSNMTSKTSGNSLEVKISPSNNAIIANDEIKFKITFLQPNNNEVQVHVDYDFIIIHNDIEIFSASRQTGQPLLHTAEGTVTIPYSFLSPGLYKMKVLVFGINFIPINPESAEFTIQVN